MPDRLANEAWEALLTAHARLLRRFAGEDWEELSMREYDVLYTLAKQPEPLRIGDLGESVLLSQPGLSRLVDRLVQRGLVERAADPADGRSVRIRLTPAGAACQKAVGRRHARAVAQAMSVLTPSELDQLRHLATKLATPTTIPEPVEGSSTRTKESHD
jgi:DNA-binding MarR family transcriptional regulator